MAYLVGERTRLFFSECRCFCVRVCVYVGQLHSNSLSLRLFLPTLWPIISRNIGHRGLCEAAAPFAFLIQKEHCCCCWWDCRYEVVGAVVEEGGSLASEVVAAARLLSLLMKGRGQSRSALKRDRGVFPTAGR